MSHTLSIKLDDETYKVVKKLADVGRGRGRGPKEPTTIGEMASDLVHTGAFRRVAANKWARENAPAPKPKKAKAKAKKAAPKARKPVKAKAAKKKAPAAKKAKKPAAPKAAAPSAPTAAPAAPAALLD